jgi:hypothetical protein
VEGGVLPDLNGRLSAEDRARDLATRALLEEKLCFYHVCCWKQIVIIDRAFGSSTILTYSPQTRERWLDHFYVMRDHALSSMPWPIRVLIGQICISERGTKEMREARLA